MPSNRLEYQRAYYKKRRAADPVFAARVRNPTKLYRSRRETWAKGVISHIRCRARNNGIAFDLAVDDIVVPTHCPVLGVELVFGTSGHRHGPSIDRVRPELGYVKGNVAVISRKANAIKSDCTDPAELRAVADYVERQLGRDL